jgi:plasmid stabilization system protein ParE
VTQVVWAPQAIQDVEAIRTHIARDSTHYAHLVVERIVAAIERLADHPGSGRSTATTESSTVCGMTLSRSRPSSTQLACFDSTDGRDIRGSNFRLQPTAARFAPRGG